MSMIVLALLAAQAAPPPPRSPRAEPPPVAAATKNEPLPWRHANEQEWLVAAVSEHVAKLLVPSLPAQAVTVASSTAAPSAIPQYTITVALKPPVSQTVALADHVWAARAYAPPLAGALVAATKAGAGRLD